MPAEYPKGVEGIEQNLIQLEEISYHFNSLRANDPRLPENHCTKHLMPAKLSTFAEIVVAAAVGRSAVLTAPRLILGIATGAHKTPAPDPLSVDCTAKAPRVEKGLRRAGWGIPLARLAGSYRREALYGRAFPLRHRVQRSGRWGSPARINRGTSVRLANALSRLP